MEERSSHEGFCRFGDVEMTDRDTVLGAGDLVGRGDGFRSGFVTSSNVTEG